MNIYEFAMQMEQDGETFYRKLAAQSSSVGVKRLLTMLAEDEVKHYGVVRQMAQEAAPEMTESRILAEARNVFAGMKGTAFNLEGEQVDLYREAQDIERRSQVFYEEQALRVSVPTHKTLLLRMAEEEKRHRYLLDAVIEFLDRPRVWMENAEFNHLEDY
jgi:rubrerythrin